MYYMDHLNVKAAYECLTKRYLFSKEANDSTAILNSIIDLGLLASTANWISTATSRFQQAIDLGIAIGRDDKTLFAIFNLSEIYILQGLYDKAEAIALKGLQINPNDSKINNSLGNVYMEWGLNDKAIIYYNNAIEHSKQLGDNYSAPLHNIGMIYSRVGKNEEAIEYFNKSIDYMKKELLHADAIGKESLNRDLGYAMLHLAGDHYQLSNVDTSFALLDSIMNVYDNNNIYHNNVNFMMELTDLLSTLQFYALGDDTLAINTMKRALASPLINEAPTEKAKLFSSLANMYSVLGDESDPKYYNTAINYQQQAVDIYDNLRKTAEGSIKRDYLASVIHAYDNMIYYNAKNKDLKSTYLSIEKSRGKFFFEQISDNENSNNYPPIQSLQNSLSNEQAIIVYANLSYDELIELIITKDKIDILHVPDSLLLKTLYPDNRFANEKLAVKSYRNSIMGLDKKSETIMFSKAFYNYLIRPFENFLKGKSELIIVPEGILGYIPFEALIDNNGHYLVETYNIKYSQSLSVWNQIRMHPEKKYDKELLAFGGAIYDDQSYAVDTVYNDKMLKYLIKNTTMEISTRGPLGKSYASLGYANWKNLPGTINEINLISTIIDDTDKISGKEVNEHNIKELSKNNELSKYKMLHFATHGVVVPDMPELSALVLSQFENNAYDEDGYLRMEEIAKLNISADFINLSACETGIGKIYPGEGVVGLTQAFILAGGNSVSVSLWPISDKGTIQFMGSFYGNIADGVSYSTALTNTKIDFILGKFGNEYKKPYYWAPFVYYGK